MTDLSRGITVGDKVERIEGRREDIGRTGVVARVTHAVAGDVLVVVVAEDGSTWSAYTRQVERVGV